MDERYRRRSPFSALPTCGALGLGPVRANEEVNADAVHLRMKEARAQARFAVELATIQVDCGRCFVVGQPANSNLWRAKVMRRADSDAQTIVVSRRCESPQARIRWQRKSASPAARKT